MFFIRIWWKGTIFIDDSTSKPVDIISVSAGLAEKTKTYIAVSTLSMFVTYIRLLQYFTFSNKLSAYQDIILASSFPLLFFVLLYLVLLFGFAICFFAVYGTEIKEFSTLAASLLTSLRMSMGEFLYEEMVVVSENFTSPVYILFKVIFSILLQNMFIAIISAHYFQHQREVAEDKVTDSVSTFLLVLSILRNKLKEEGGDQDIDDEEDLQLVKKKGDKKEKKMSFKEKVEYYTKWVK